MRGSVNGALQLRDQIGNRPLQIVRNMPDGPPVARLLRLNSNSLKQRRHGNVVSVRDKRYRHPGLDGLVLRLDEPGLPARP